MTTSIPNVTSAFGSSVAIQPDGKIIAVGNDGGSGDVHFIVIRYTITGSLDSSFNNTGIVTNSFNSYTNGSSVAIQDDGKIVVAGSGGSNFVLARYTITGSLDLSFNNTGVVTTPISTFSTSGAAVTIQPDGKIVVAGNSWINAFGDSDLAVARYTITGSLDSTFNNTGVVHTAIGNRDEKVGIALQPNGKIVVTSLKSGFGKSDITVVRYNQAGSLDTTFKGTGIVTTSIGNSFAQGRSIAVQSDGKIVVAGGDSSNFVVVRYLGDPNLHLSKTVNNPFPNPNQLITYTITMSNSGNFSATNVIISDTLPGGVTLAGPVVLTPPEAGRTGTPPILAHNLTIGVDQLITVTIPVIVNNNLIGGTIITNIAVVTNVETFPITASTIITIANNPVITLTKTTNVETANIGETITYTYQVTNTGNVSLTNIVANDTPLGTIPLNTNNLAPNQATTGILTYTIVEADLPGPLSNIAVVTGTFLTGNITATAQTTVALTYNAAFTLSKTANVTTTKVGKTITYTYQITNTGNVSLTNLIANDIPLGPISFNINSLAPNQATTGILTYTVTTQQS